MCSKAIRARDYSIKDYKCGEKPIRDQLSYTIDFQKHQPSSVSTDIVVANYTNVLNDLSNWIYYAKLLTGYPPL